MADTYFILHTETYFDSAHHLEGYLGSCANIHGHIWRLRVWVKGELHHKDSVGILFDFSNIKSIQQYLDHKYLNKDCVEFSILNPTAENISRIIYEQLKQKRPELNFLVRLYETPLPKETWCQYGDQEEFRGLI